MKKTRMDIFLLAGLLIVGLLLAGFVYLPHGGNGSVVEVRIKGKVTATYPLSSNIEKTITTEAGDSNTFCIKDQKVTMTHASCPDQICVRTVREMSSRKLQKAPSGRGLAARSADWGELSRRSDVLPAYSHFSHTSGQYPTAACRPLRTIGWRSSC